MYFVIFFFEGNGGIDDNIFYCIRRDESLNVIRLRGESWRFNFMRVRRLKCVGKWFGFRGFSLDF